MAKPIATTLSLFLDTGRIIKSRMERSMPLPFAQCETLRLVEELTNPNMRDIAQSFKITAPSATSLVNDLVRGGYIKREPNAKDRRVIHLSLTKKGDVALKKVISIRKKVLTGILRSLNADDHVELNKILKKIISNA